MCNWCVQHIFIPVSLKEGITSKSNKEGLEKHNIYKVKIVNVILFWDTIMYKLEAAKTEKKTPETETLTFMKSEIHEDPSLGVCCDFYIPCYCVWSVLSNLNSRPYVLSILGLFHWIVNTSRQKQWLIIWLQCPNVWGQRKRTLIWTWIIVILAHSELPMCSSSCEPENSWKEVLKVNFTVLMLTVLCCTGALEICHFYNLGQGGFVPERAQAHVCE